MQPRSLVWPARDGLRCLPPLPARGSSEQPLCTHDTWWGNLTARCCRRRFASIHRASERAISQVADGGIASLISELPSSGLLGISTYLFENTSLAPGTVVSAIAYSDHAPRNTRSKSVANFL